MKDGTSCVNLGVLYYEGKGVRQSYKIAKEYFGRGCDLGNEKGCAKYAELNKRGL